ncbi:MAG TPA: nicotinate (nicotinamide) nucleotide adenylyltransferase [Candidatus Sumerlaeota bacterium]|nr:MAG: Nicotinate-nucleotide adenylyltransferase [candidate division BRC1 bacterium ADurb.BinA292]HOE95964.1 nicotinate (nicotinamide) nucleotide adenylyltransferase [Candidatus Sumerlaeota bacterium]HOR27762.1 nicotinate (nicotinamide) nucleotide adenylyltransferase [Candidatus Sumerlaeota bacterium]HPK01370.1 nicotinate (nicotinamide) nucleotide adenylyltransferase [Candidatus Sumerlaeota bacterium]
MSGAGQTIGLFGGSFNPPHVAHVLVVGWALAGGAVDEVWVIPTGGHPFGKPLAPFEDRLELCRRAFACFGPKVRVLDLERGPDAQYSIDTLRRLQARHPDLRWRWIMGSDQLADAARWKNFDEIMRLAPPLVVPRAGHAVPGASGDGAPPRFALPDLSSTFLRERLAAGAFAELAGLIPGPVLDEIDKRGLYRPV